MINTEIKQKLSSLPPVYKKTGKWIIIICIILVLYIFSFFILKSVMISKAKDIMVNKGIGSSKNAIKLDVGINPFNWWTGKVSYLNIYVDVVNIEKTIIIHDLEIKTRKVNIKRLNQGDFTTPIGAQISCKLNENDFLSLLKERLRENSPFTQNIELSSRLGMIYLNTGYPFNKEYSAEPMLQNNCIYLRINQGYMTLLPVKIIDFGAVTENKLNVYQFQYINGSFELKGNIV